MLVRFYIQTVMQRNQMLFHSITKVSSRLQLLELCESDESNSLLTIRHDAACELSGSHGATDYFSCFSQQRIVSRM